MRRTFVCYLGGLLALVFHISSVSCQLSEEIETITIECNGIPTWQNTEIYGQFIELQPSSNLTIVCRNVQKEITFIILQVHTHRHNIVLYQKEIRRNTSFTGTNVGMYSRNYDERTTNENHTFSVANFNEATVKMYVSIHAYNESAPIPGGCNLVSPVEINPTISLSLLYDDSVMRLSADPSKINDQEKCGVEKFVDSNVYIYHTFYRLYMSEQNYDELEYFDSIRKMMTVKGIEENGVEMPHTLINNSELLRLHSVYPGTGSIHVVVVRTTFGSAVYVPTHTYGCTLTDEQQTCNIFNDIFTQVLCALMCFVGLFVCYFGHRCIKTEMFLMGLMAGAIVTYIVMLQHTNLDSAELSAAVLVSGVFCGAIWWLLWWFYGVPVYSVLLPTTLVGFLSACLVMSSLPDGIPTLEIDLSYWSLFFIIMLITPILLTFATLNANILSCAVLGAYATVYSIDMYIGSSLKYVVINVIRRAVVPEFENAYTATPFQWRDIIIVLLWLMLSITGFLFQKYHNMGRAPFPPPPRNTMPGVALRSDYRVLYGEESHNVRPSRRRSRVSRPTDRTPLLA